MWSTYARCSYEGLRGLTTLTVLLLPVSRDQPVKTWLLASLALLAAPCHLLLYSSLQSLAFEACSVSELCREILRLLSDFVSCFCFIILEKSCAGFNC